MSTYDPFIASRRMALPPPHAVYAAHCLDGGWFARCDGCGWHGELLTAETEAWAAAIEHTVTNGKESA